MTVRSEGQFNTVVYEEEDLYRGQTRRDVILLHPGRTSSDYSCDTINSLPCEATSAHYKTSSCNNSIRSELATL